MSTEAVTVGEATAVDTASVQVRGWSTASFLRSLVAEPKGAIGLVLSSLFCLGGVTGLVILTVPQLQYLYLQQDLLNILKGPLSPGHWLGTDALGRDMLARALAGMGLSLAISVCVTAISLVLGVALGLTAGYRGGVVDVVVRGFTDLAWGFPLILLAVVLAGVLGASAFAIILAVGLLGWAPIARVIRGYGLSLRTKEFVVAARICGLPPRKVIVRHLLPNVYAPTLVFASYSIAAIIIVEAGVSYLGLGVQPPTPSLGTMLANGQDYIYSQPWQIWLPCIILVVGALGFNLLGDAIRDVLDPKLARLPN